MLTHTTNEAMTAWSVEQHAAGLTVGFVPTMGFLHAGHASLMAKLRPLCDKLVVSVFVNPLQFGEGEDLDRYPRDPEGDAAICREQGVDAMFMPGDFYPDGFSTAVSVHGLTDGLCGAARPGHFDGVSTVVTRLFGVTRCDLACFGEKDWQQLAVIRRMVTDLALPVRVVPAALMRDPDGLAMSSRNTFLSTEERERGLSLNRALSAMAASDSLDAAELLELGRGLLQCDRLDYLELVDAVSLQPVETVDRPCRALVAGFFGRTRLIDNMAVGPELAWN